MTYFYDGTMIPLYFNEPAIPGVGDEVSKISKNEDDLVIYSEISDIRN